MARKETKKSQLEKQYEQQIHRINRTIRGYENQGYRLATNPIPKKPKKISEGTIRKLKNITPKYIRQHYNLVDESGNIISAETGELLYESSEYHSKAMHPSNEKGFDNVRQDMDYEDYENVKSLPNSADTVLDNVREYLSQERSRGHVHGADAIEQLILDTINRISREATAKQLAEHPEFWDATVGYVGIYNGYGNGATGAYNEIFRILNGAPITAEDARRIANQVELDDDGESYL